MERFWSDLFSMAKNWLLLKCSYLYDIITFKAFQVIFFDLSSRRSYASFLRPAGLSMAQNGRGPRLKWAEDLRIDVFYRGSSEANKVPCLGSKWREREREKEKILSWFEKKHPLENANPVEKTLPRFLSFTPLRKLKIQLPHWNLTKKVPLGPERREHRKSPLLDYVIDLICNFISNLGSYSHFATDVPRVWGPHWDCWLLFFKWQKMRPCKWTAEDTWEVARKKEGLIHSF